MRRPRSSGGARRCAPRPTSHGALVAVARVPPIEPRADRGQHDGQQGHGDRDADQRDEHPGDAEAAQEGHGQDDEGQQ